MTGWGGWREEEGGGGGRREEGGWREDGGGGRRDRTGDEELSVRSIKKREKSDRGLSKKTKRGGDAFSK